MYSQVYLPGTVDSIIAKAVAEAKEEEEIPEIEYETVEDEVTVPITRKVDPVVTFLYKIDDDWITDYEPKQKLHDGENIISLLYPISGLGANSAKRLEVYMTVEGGKMTIAPANCKAAVAGSGIASGYTEWDGKILVEEYVDVYKMGDNSVKLIKLSESLDVSTMKETIRGFTDAVSLFHLNSSMNLIGLTDHVQIE